MKRGFSGVMVVKNLPAKAGDRRDTGSIPRLGRSPGIGSDNSLQTSCLGNPTDRGVWQATVHRVTKDGTQLSTHTHTHTHTHTCTHVHAYTHVHTHTHTYTHTLKTSDPGWR